MSAFIHTCFYKFFGERLCRRLVVYNFENIITSIKPVYYSCQIDGFSIFENQLAQMEFQRKLHFSNSLPKISLFATGGYGRPDYQFYFARPDWYYMAGVSLRVPLIDWAKSTGVAKVIGIQKQILESQEADFKKSNQIAIQDKLNEINRLEHLIVLDKAINEKYAELTKTYSSQLANGTITVTDYIRQHNDELTSLMNQEIHNIQLLKTKYELMALRGEL